MQQPSNIIDLPVTASTDAQLVESASLGDRQAFSVLIRSCESMLYRIAWSITFSDADAADATQEAIFKAWRALPKLRNANVFRSWLVRILINECKQVLRQRKHRGEMPELELIGPSHLSDEALDVRRALLFLPERQRSIIMLYYYEDFSVQHISSVLKLPQGTIKSRLFAARKALKRLLEVDGE